MPQSASATSKSPIRRRGRPPIAIGGRATRERLLDAAALEFAESGFGGATLGSIAERAGVTTGAIYNHFNGKEDLLLAASRHALDEIGPPPDPNGDPAEVAAAAASAFMGPEFAGTRRLLVELHLTASRSPDLQSLLAEWHRERLSEWLPHVPSSDETPSAVVKAYFLVLMGLTHIDALGAIEATQPELESIAGRLCRALFGDDER